jgi:hypothetical protein
MLGLSLQIGVIHMTDPPSQVQSGDGETALFLVKHGRRGFVAHIPDSSGHPICKKTTLSGWTIEVRLVAGTLICDDCKAIEAKLARS